MLLNDKKAADETLQIDEEEESDFSTDSIATDSDLTDSDLEDGVRRKIKFKSNQAGKIYK